MLCLTSFLVWSTVSCREMLMELAKVSDYLKQSTGLNHLQTTTTVHWNQLKNESVFGNSRCAFIGSDQGLLLLLIPVFRVLCIQISNLRQAQDTNLNWFTVLCYSC